MVNKLCTVCAKTCKQSDSTKIVSCPKFLKNPTDIEFRNMIDELDDAEKNVRSLQKNVREIIKNTLSENSPEPKGSEEIKPNDAEENEINDESEINGETE